MQRTEADILSKTPIKIRLGEKDYEVKPLTLGPARKWRASVTQAMNTTLSSFQGTNVSPENLAPGLSAAMISFPEKLLDLICGFAPDLPRETIENEATDEQLAIAYAKVMALGFPFLAPLMMTQKVLTASR